VRGISRASDLAEELLELKIGVFHPPIHPKHFGGSVAVTVPIVNGLIENGYHVVLFVKDEINQKKLKERLGEEISPLAEVVLKKSILRPRGPLDLYESGFKLLMLKMKCDIVIDTYSDYIFPWCDVCYVHFPYINNDRFGQRFPYLRKRRGLESTVNLPYVILEKNLGKNHAQLVLANSGFTSRAIEESLGIHAKVLYPPVSSLFFEKTDGADFGEDRREDLVVTVARLDVGKRLEIIPRIASMLRKEKVKFVIIGFSHSAEVLGMINEEIRRLDVTKNVSLELNISREELKDTLRKAKVYLHTPILEHFGISIAEAMACGCLPVVYDNGGAREFVPQELRYESLPEAADKTRKAIDRWNPRRARDMNAIAERFAEPNYRENFIRIFSDYLRMRG
jgi:glycosyltransferase involved in cell wall biosynthesis